MISGTSQKELSRPEIGFIAITGLTAIASLVVGMYAGLMRMGISLPGPVGLSAFHGQLMLFGFLGVLISLERFVAIRNLPSGLAVFCLASGMWLTLAGFDTAATAAIVAGTFFFMATLVHLSLNHPELHHWIMSAGAFGFFGAASLWANGYLIRFIVPWWVSYLLWTIAAERLELSRFKNISWRAKSWKLVNVVLSFIGLGLAFYSDDIGMRVFGLSIGLTAIWLWVHDISKQTASNPGLSGFMGRVLRGGYIWLFLSGLGLITHGFPVSAFAYDAIWHAFFLGFVFSMIFAHAPVILPALTGIKVSYHSAFYLAPVILYLGLIMRLAGDFFVISELRSWGGGINVLAIVCFGGLVIWRIGGDSTQSESSGPG
jgi:hypothetical protein